MPDTGRMTDRRAGPSLRLLPSPVNPCESMAKEEVITEDLECADPVLATKASSSDGLPLAEAEPVVDERTFLSELPFIAVVASGQLMAQAQTGSCFLPVRLIGEALGTQEPGELSWTAASYGSERIANPQLGLSHSSHID